MPVPKLFNGGIDNAGKNPALKYFWLGFIILGLFGADWFADPVIQVHYFAVVLIGIVAWLTTPKPAYILGVVLPIIRLVSRLVNPPPWGVQETIANTGIQIAVLLIVVYMLTKIKALTHEIKLARAKVPICAYCKNIRSQKGEWEAIETYISRQADVSFTHGICPDCGEKYFGEILKKGRMLGTSS